MLARDPRAWAIFGLALCSLGLPLLCLHGYDLATQFEDDAFYYFQFARQLARGEALASNGFHPLWVLVLTPVFAAVSGADSAVRAAGSLEASLVGGAAVLTYAALRERLGRTHAMLAGLLLFALPGTRSVLRAGLESALTLCLLAAVWLAHERRRGAWLAALCALLSLARLEAASVVLIVAWLEQRRGRALFLLAGPTAAALLAFALWNQLRFGAPLPVSGAVKMLWARDSDVLWLRALALPLMAAVAFGGKHVPAYARLPVLSAAFILSCDLALLGHVERWYLGPALLAAAVLAASVMRWHRLALAALALGTLSALARVPNTLHSVHQETYQARVRGEAADWLRTHTPPRARAGAWSSGMLGYYSEREVVNLDGLANTPSFYRRALEHGDLLGYLREQRITRLLTLACELPPQLRAAYVLQGPASDRPRARSCDDAFGVWVAR